MRISTPEDLLERLAVDPGKRTLGELLQERESARLEILALRERLATLTREMPGRRSASSPNRAPVAPEPPIKGDAPVVAPETRMMRLHDVEAMLGVKRSTIYQWIARGRFPRQVRLGARVVAWRLADILAWQKTLGS